MFTELGFQLYTIRDYIKNPEICDVALGKVKALGYTECHGACMEDKPYLFDLLKKHGILLTGNHYDLNLIKADPEKVLEKHAECGAKTIGTGAMWGDTARDYDKLMEYIEDFNNLAETCSKYGFKLTYHNHSFEFTRIKGYKTIMEVLYENLNPSTTSFVLDTCWVAAGGHDVIDWMEKLKGRIDVLHLKDLYMKYDQNRVVPADTEIGNGSLSWDKIMAKAEEIDVKYYCVEQDTCPYDSIQSLGMSAEFLKKYMA